MVRRIFFEVAHDRGGLSARTRELRGSKKGTNPKCAHFSHAPGTMTNEGGKRRRRSLLPCASALTLALLPPPAVDANASSNGRRPPNYFHAAQRQRRAHADKRRDSNAVHVEPEYVPHMSHVAADHPHEQQQAAAATIDSSGNARVLNAAVNDGASSSEPSAKLRADLLSNYDRGTFPWEEVWSTASSPNNRTGVPIEIGINFHRVHNVDVIEGTVDLIVWFRLRWTDPRLTWNPADYGNLTTTWFWIEDGGGSAGETSEMWTPDLQLWNLDEGLEESLSDTYASVQSDGTVFWSRPGHLRPTCKFTGLDDFPYDTLGCQMEFGSWSYSGLYVRPILMGLGYSIGGSETAGQSFSEFRIPEDDEEPVVCKEHVYPPYPSAPEEDWPVVMCNVKFKRSWQPYTRGYILLQVILNFAGFASFWLPVACGERISLTITALLAAVASELVVASSLPSAAEMTWFQSFSIFSLVYAAMALFESVAVIYFFYNHRSTLKPRWYVHVEKRWKEGKNDSPGADAPARESLPVINEDISEHHDANLEIENKSDGDELRKDVKVNWRLSGIAGNKEATIDSSDRQRKVESAPETTGGPLSSIDMHGSNGPAMPKRPTLNSSQLYMSPSGRIGRDAEDFAEEAEIEANIYWKKVSHRIDDVSRVFFPSTYIIVLIILLVRVSYAS